MQIGQVFNPFGLFTGCFIPDCIFYDHRLSPSAKLLYGRLLRYAGKHGIAWPKQSTLADEMGLSNNQIIILLKELENNKYIIIEKPSGIDRLQHKPNKYHFIWNESLEKFSNIIETQEIPGDNKNITSGGNKQITSGNNRIVSSNRREKIREERKKEEGTSSYNLPSLKNNQEQTLPIPKQRVKLLPSKFTNNDILQIWNEGVDSTPVRKINQITSSRADKIAARRKEGLETERDWHRLMNKILHSDFLCGNNDRNWTVTFDWITTNSTNWVKVMEGNYDNKKDKSPNQSNRFTPSGGIRCQDKSKYDHYMESAEVINNDR